MGRPVVDLTGKRYGKLTVLKLHDKDFVQINGRKEKQWECVCDCGNHIIVTSNKLKATKNPENLSCGCDKPGALNTENGNTYGDLTVLSGFKKGKKIYYHCKCSCGNEIDVFRNDLINNKRTHCGCKIPKERPERVKDLSGQRFGKLTVVEKDTNTYFTSGGKKLYKWVCKCDCGNTISAERNRLKSGHVKSCGCLMAEKQGITLEEYNERYKKVKNNSGRAKDLTNQRFGKLVALQQDGYAEYNGRKVRKWLCKCDCGSYVSVTRNNLTSGHTQSCGCIDSTGEATIVRLLNSWNITYQKEYTFDDCKDKSVLPFDFGVLKEEKLICVIEFDGLQHFQKVRFNGMTEERAQEAFEIGQIHDRIKNDYCQKNNIPLLRIKYSEIENIEQILLLFLNQFKLFEQTGDVCA